MKKISGFFLLFALSLSLVAVLASCKPTESSSSDSNESESTLPDERWYDNLNFNGETLVISQSINVWSGCPTVDNAEKYTRGPAEVTSDGVLNLCYSRNNEVKNALGLNIKYTEVDYAYNEINPYIDSLAVMNGNKIPDLLINDEYALSSAQLKGQLYNVMDQSEENHFNFEHESWYMDYMLGFTIDPEKVYGLGGDYFFDIVRTARALYINIELFEVMCRDHYESIEDFYKMIEDGYWDYDEFADLISAGWKSTSGSSYATLNDEIIGFLFTSNDGYMQIIPASGISMIERGSDGKYAAKQSILELSGFTEALNDLLHSDGIVHANHNGEADFRKIFTEGGALFLNGYYLGDLEFPSFYAMEEKSVIVYPKWNESQTRYYTTIHDSAEIGYIMKNTDSFTSTSAYVQLLSEESVDVMSEYFVSVQYKYNTDHAAIKMLNTIRDTIYRSPEMYIGSYAKASLLNVVPAAVKANNPPQATNTYESNLPTYIRTINELYTIFENLY